MVGERIKRIIFLILGGLLMTWITTGLVKWWQNRKILGESIKLPSEVITEKLEELSGQVLGKAIEVLPGNGKIKEKITGKEAFQKETESLGEGREDYKKTFEIQTKEIIEVLKKLPEEQLKQIKKEIFKDFCQQVMGE